MMRLILFVVFLFGSLVTWTGYAKSMNKNDLVAYVEGRTSLSHAQAAEAVDAVLDGITETLAKGSEVRIVGFGTFSVAHRSAREGRNPSTGERIIIPASNQPKFKAGKALKNAVNKARPLAPADRPQDEGTLHEPREEAPTEPSQVIKVTDECLEQDGLKFSGTVKWFNPAKGFGFIQPSDGSKDSFVHISAVERAGLHSLQEGQKVEYVLRCGLKGKTSAENLRVLE